MKHSLLYFIAAALFVIAIALELSSDGITLKVIAGAIMAGVMMALGLKSRRAGN